MIPILSGNVASATASTTYNVANSCRFNDGDSAYMHLTSGSAGNRRTFTFSCWWKRASISTGATQSLLVGSSCESFIDIGSNDKLIVAMQDSGGSPSVTTNRVFRDIGAWYHICIAVDTTQGTDTNRIKIYINGTIIPVADLSVTAWPSSSEQATFNDGNKHYLGANCSPGQYLDGYLAEVCLIDGLALAPTSFGEFDEDSPTIWKPIDVSGLTFGNEGWYLDFEDSGDLGDDESGNGNDFTEVNLAATDQATDTPTNNFCTLNPLEAVTATTTYAEGNTQGTTSNAARATFAVSNGKWYWEHKFVNKEAMGGVMAYSGFRPNDYSINALIQGSNPELVLNGTEQSSWSGDGTPDAMVDNDILNVALDCDNNRIAFGVNGAYLNATDGSGEWSGTTLNYYSISDGYDYAPAFRTGSGTNRESHFNFGGCPGFAISSGNADANGYGNFEYAVPSGFFALCTKNLAEYG